jgi:Na+-transporting methylmalonyl-CoA/oxaloacetate decarboxylase gamma subunit
MDKLEFALQVMVLGFLVVMVTLFLLYVILLLFNRLFSQPAKESSTQPQAAKQKSTANKEAAVNEPVTAAVMAAVYRYMQIEETGDHKYSLRINVQPSGSGTIMNWQMVGRKILLENRIKLEQSRRNK